MATGNSPIRPRRQPPAWRAIETAKIPRSGRLRTYAALDFNRLRKELGKGLAIEFTVHPSTMLDLVAYVRSRIQLPVGVRLYTKRGNVVFYPLPRRRAMLFERQATRPVLEETFRSRMRADALIRLIVSDAADFLACTPGIDVRSALNVFALEHGDTDYGLAFNAETLVAWMDRVEAGDLLSPHAQGFQGASAPVRTEG